MKDPRLQEPIVGFIRQPGRIIPPMGGTTWPTRLAPLRLGQAWLRYRHELRPEHQQVADHRHRIGPPRPGVAREPPFVALPVGNLRRVLAEDHLVEAFLTCFGERVDDVGERREVDTAAGADSLDAESCRQMTFAGTGLTNEMHDFMAIDEVELGERKDPVTVERRLEREVEAGQRL